MTSLGEAEHAPRNKHAQITNETRKSILSTKKYTIKPPPACAYYKSESGPL